MEMMYYSAGFNEHGVWYSFEMWITGDHLMTPGSGCCEDDGVGNPAFESLAPEFTCQNGNFFCHGYNKTPDTNL